MSTRCSVSLQKVAISNKLNDSLPKMVGLINDEDLMSNPLRTEKAVKAGREFKQFVKSVAKRNNDRHTMISP